ncbi:MAG: molecular chaperone DnaK, partial [Halanaerobium sp.]
KKMEALTDELTELSSELYSQAEGAQAGAGAAGAGAQAGAGAGQAGPQPGAGASEADDNTVDVDFEEVDEDEEK